MHLEVIIIIYQFPKKLSSKRRHNPITIDGRSLIGHSPAAHNFVKMSERAVEWVPLCVFVSAQVEYAAEFALSGFSELTRYSLKLWCGTKAC
jgi:hypothetical protein